MTTTSYPTGRYNIIVFAVIVIMIGMVFSVGLAFYQAFWHNYSETRAACEKHGLVLSETSAYSMARCTDVHTGIVYDPQYLGGPQTGAPQAH